MSENMIGKIPLLQHLLACGCNLDCFDHHGTDLYVPVTERSARSILEWCGGDPKLMQHMAPKFVDAIDHKLCFDCAFAYCAVDEVLETLWCELGDVPMDPETECLEEQFMHFPAGTFREDVWQWFDKHHSHGVAYLMYEKE